MIDVKWSQWDRRGKIAQGVLPLAIAASCMRGFGAMAKALLKKSGAAHVLYGLVIYEDDRVAVFQFYMTPMDDDEFERNCGRITNAQVYAVHRR